MDLLVAAGPDQRGELGTEGQSMVSFVGGVGVDDDEVLEAAPGADGSAKVSCSIN